MLRLALISLAALALPGWGAETIAGCIKTVQGGSIVRRGTQTVTVQEGMHLFADDVLETAADGRLSVIFQDGTRISIGPGTELKIDRFLYEPVNGKFALLLRLARGVLAYISGKIAQFSPDAAKVETPVGIVGLRGTHFGISIEGI